MKHLFSNRSIPLLVSVTMATVALSTLQAESHCPAGIANVTPRFVQRALIVIPVRINEAGPFDFMVDTGSQVTVIDPSLAAELNLRPQGRVGLVSVASVAHASVTLLDRLEADSHVVEKSPAIVQDLRQIQAADPRIRGVLGESFLDHFDLLIDYGHKLLCLDETSAMRDSVPGEHVLFVPPQHPADELPFMERLVISVHLSGTGARAILLQLDSGSDGPILYAFEIVAEQEDGYVIVAAEDIDLTAFLAMVDGFSVQVHGSAMVAQVHKLFDDPSQVDRLRQILSDRLFEHWPQIADDQTYIVDIGIACSGTQEIPAKPNRGKRQGDADWARSEQEWSQARLGAYDQWDEVKRTRENEIEDFAANYGAEILHLIDNSPFDAGVLPDSFTVRLRISGRGLRDLILNYAYIFEVVEPEDIALPQQTPR